MPQQTMVRTYTSPDHYRKDAERMANAGWTVSSVAERRPRPGCLRVFLLLGIFALVFPPKPEIIVTYARGSDVRAVSGNAAGFVKCARCGRTVADELSRCPWCGQPL